MGTKSIKRRRLASQPEANNSRKILIGGAVVLGVVALGVLLFLSLQEPQALQDLQRFAGLSRGHDENVTYTNTGLPPVGGIHSGVWQNCGIYDQPVDTKNAIHSMEHGAVWMTYHPDLSESDVSKLQNLAKGQSYVLLSPYPDLQSPVVLTAWGIQLQVNSVNDSRIAEFINRYQAGPQTPELGATCEGGLGEPILQ
jgi:hypothetical protein